MGATGQGSARLADASQSQIDRAPKALNNQGDVVFAADVGRGADDMVAGLLVRVPNLKVGAVTVLAKVTAF